MTSLGFALMDGLDGSPEAQGSGSSTLGRLSWLVRPAMESAALGTA